MQSILSVGFMFNIKYLQSILYSKSLILLLTADCVRSSPFMTILLTRVSTGGLCREEGKSKRRICCFLFVLARIYKENWTCHYEKRKRKTQKNKTEPNKNTQKSPPAQTNPKPTKQNTPTNKQTQIWEESENASRVCCFIVWVKEKS